jgi:hypothetical protein
MDLVGDELAVHLPQNKVSGVWMAEIKRRCQVSQPRVERSGSPVAGGSESMAMPAASNND